MGYSADDVEQIHERPRDQRVQVDSRTYTVSRCFLRREVRGADVIACTVDRKRCRSMHDEIINLSSVDYYLLIIFNILGANKLPSINRGWVSRDGSRARDRFLDSSDSAQKVSLQSFDISLYVCTVRFFFFLFFSSVSNSRFHSRCENSGSSFPEPSRAVLSRREMRY